LKDNVMCFFTNSKNEQKLDWELPMPAGEWGCLRVTEDAKGNVLFVGEDRLDHTPKDDIGDDSSGNAFDMW